MSIMQRESKKLWYFKLVLLIAASLGCFYVGTAEALVVSGVGPSQTLGDVAAHVTTSMSNLAKLISAASYVAGMGFAVGAIFKFKAHKDNPTQIPIGTPIALIFIAAALIFLPSLFQMAGETLFGSSATTGGLEGDNPYTQNVGGF